MQKRNVLNSPRLLELKKHRRKDFQNKIWLIVSAAVAVCALSVYILRLPSLNISNTEVSGNKVIDSKSIQDVVEKDTSGKYLWLIPKTSVFFYPKKVIQNDLADKFKRLMDIKISLKKTSTLGVTVSERQGSYAWCGGVPQFNNADESCYFLDDTGYIFDHAPYFSGNVYFKFYGSTDGNVDTPIGSYFSKNNFKQLVAFNTVLGQMGLKTFALSVADTGDATIYLSNQTTTNSYPEIIFKSDADFKNIAENLDSALSTDPLKTDFQKKYGSLLYIDLRYGNKVYYKFK